MKKVGILVFVVLAFAVLPVSVNAGQPTPPCPKPSSPSNPSNPNNMMGPGANNTINTALDLKEKAHSLFDQAEGQDIDVSEFEELLEKADALLEKALKIMRVNPIPAMNMAREAAEMYESIISDLEALLG